MKSALRLCLCGCVVGLVAAPELALAAVVDMEVVAINGSPITPATDITVANGDQFTVEYFVRNWAPDAILTYQLRVDGASLSSGPAGSLMLAQLPCTDNAQCTVFPSCDGTVCDCKNSVFVTESRTDYLFYTRVGIVAPDCTSEWAAVGSYGFGATLLNPAHAASDTGVRRYLGTMILEVDDVACGDFTVGILNDPNQTFMENTDNGNLTLDLSATILVHTPPTCPTTGACCNTVTFECTDGVFEGDCTGQWTAETLCADLDPPCAPQCTFVSADPPGCAVDGRQPHELNNAAVKFGWDAFDITFNPGCSTGGLAAGDFNIVQYPNNTPAPPTVTGVSDLGGGTVEVQLSSPINPGRWTCLVLASDPAQDFCWGYLPADVDSSLDSSPSDIIKVIDCINGVASIPCDPWQVDIDRSGALDPSDIIRVIDLLNGASAFQPWFGRVLDPARCPD